MKENPSDPLADGLVFEDALPLCWEVVDDLPDAAHLARLNEADEALLRVISALEEYRPEPGEEHAEVAQELARLDFKLSLVLDLVGQLLSRQLTLPESLPVRLGARGLEWPAADPPRPGAHLIVSLYLHPGYPRPLELPGVVAGVDPLPVGGRVRLAFRGLGEPVEDWLEKFIFRHHRRSIAHARAARVLGEGEKNKPR